MGRNVVYYSDELYHHGIKGMKWGVRRYQNPDGSLTAAGRKHRVTGYIETAGSKISGGIRNAGNAVKNKYNSLSDRQKTALKVAGGALLGAAALYGGQKAYKFVKNNPNAMLGLNYVKGLGQTTAKRLSTAAGNAARRGRNMLNNVGIDARLGASRAGRAIAGAGQRVGRGIATGLRNARTGLNVAAARGVKGNIRSAKNALRGLGFEARAGLDVAYNKAGNAARRGRNMLNNVGIDARLGASRAGRAIAGAGQRVGRGIATGLRNARTGLNVAAARGVRGNARIARNALNNVGIDARLGASRAGRAIAGAGQRVGRGIATGLRNARTGLNVAAARGVKGNIRTASNAFRNSGAGRVAGRVAGSIGRAAGNAKSGARNAYSAVKGVVDYNRKYNIWGNKRRR